MQCVCLEDLLVMILGRGPAKIDVDGVVDVFVNDCDDDGFPLFVTVRALCSKSR